MQKLAALDGLVPDRLQPKTRKIVLEEFQLDVDIGFHDFEIGRPQRLLLSVEVWVEEGFFPSADHPEDAWNAETVHMYHLLERQPELKKFLDLRPGYMAGRGPSGWKILVHDA